MTDAALLGFDPAFGGVEWLRASYSSHAYDLHAHAEYVIAIVDEGAEAFRCAGQTHVAPAGSIYTINPGEPHDGRAVGPGWRYRAFYPSAVMVERALGGRARRVERTVWRDAKAWRLLSAMHDLLAAPACALARQSAIVVALERVFVVNASRGTSLERVETLSVRLVRDLLTESYAEAHTLEALAAEVGLHPNYLLAAFKRQYGVTPALFLRAVRLDRAKAMIRSGRQLKTVAQDTGFFDQAHLTRCFRGAFGATPSAYAAACRASVRD
jgi:AraC-like DNA-binding protein